MIHLVFELANPDDEVDVFSQGHITLIGDRETVSSKDRSSMMIFLSVSTLLYGVCELVTTTKRSDEFEPIDTAKFNFEINKTSLGRLRVLYRGRTIGEASFQEFLPALKESAADFWGQYRSSLVFDNGYENLVEELDQGLRALETLINTYQPPLKKKPTPHQVDSGAKTSPRSRGLPAESDD